MSGSTTAGSSLTPASSINDLRTQALLKILERLGEIDLSPILVYTISSPPDTALPFLAWQFDMLAPWWQLLAGPASQRQLIQQAVALHRYKGTPFAIQSITNNLGLAVVTIEEGQASWGGSAWPPSEGWAVFRVVAAKAAIQLLSPLPASWDAVTDIDLLLNVDTLEQAVSVSGMAVPAQMATQLVSAIDFFKPTRSWLDSLWFQELPVQEPGLGISDAITLVAGTNVIEAKLRISDLPAVPGWVVADLKTILPIYAAHFYHAGVTYGTQEPAIADSGLVINSQPTE